MHRDCTVLERCRCQGDNRRTCLERAKASDALKRVNQVITPVMGKPVADP